MIPLALRITNFKSFRGTQSFQFPQEPGLYFMQGINEAEPRLEANGSGKSTIWDALTWCFFEITPRRAKAGTICNWEAGKGAEVEFDFMLREDDPCIWTIRRTWSPNSWTLSHAAEYVTDEEIVDLTKDASNPALEWLALAFEPWLHSVLMAQRQPMFLDLRREPQTALFSEVLGLDRWLDYSSKATRCASDQDRKMQELERELASIEGQLRELGNQDLRGNAEAWDRDQARKLDGLEAEHAQLLGRRKGLKDALERAQAREREAREALARVQPDPKLQRDLSHAAADLADVNTELRVLQGRIEHMQDSLDALRDGKACPTCGQKPGAGVDLGSMEREAMQALRQAEALSEEKKKAEAAVDRLTAQLDKSRMGLDRARDDLDAAQRETSNARRAFDLCERDLDSLEDDAEKLSKQRNPFSQMMQDQKERIEALNGRRDRLEAQLDSASERQSLYAMWVRGFKEVRLSLIADALTELEIEVNSSLDALGLIGWEMSFDVDRESKNGKLSHGFSCSIRSPQNEKPVPWEAWSGGEGQRLRLAATMGLSDLIRNHAGATIPLEVWDEPTEGLSPQGIRDLLDCLAERARRERRQIWLVDHRAHAYGGFAGGCLITKGSKGSIISNGYI